MGFSPSIAMLLKYTEYFLFVLWLYGSVTLGKSPSSFESDSLLGRRNNEKPCPTSLTMIL